MSAAFEAAAVRVAAEGGENGSSGGGDRSGVEAGGLDLGPAGVPFGVRTYREEARPCLCRRHGQPPDRARPKDRRARRERLRRRGPSQSKCTLLQTITVPAEDLGPHLLDVDRSSGDIYAALVSNKPRATEYLGLIV